MTNLKDWNVHDALACNLFLSFLDRSVEGNVLLLKLENKFSVFVLNLFN